MISSRTSGTSILGCIGALVAVTSPNLFLLCNLCSSVGRAVPDIAAQAINFLIVNGGGNFAVDGTSYAAPVCPSLLLVHPSSTRVTH